MCLVVVLTRVAEGGDSPSMMNPLGFVGSLRAAVAFAFYAGLCGLFCLFCGWEVYSSSGKAVCGQCRLRGVQADAATDLALGLPAVWPLSRCQKVTQRKRQEAKLTDLIAVAIRRLRRTCPLVSLKSVLGGRTPCIRFHKRLVVATREPTVK